ncbi:1 concanamycin induced protein c [Mycena sanguinolenta]|uniref:1 concanamycin induced protein c n=1 Tax=Mycena sanguinolenta TaxID=230812 RepID=A0A8H7D3B2_9AGAR|nr:1 concanamycin induced protein c [Mycena sanguinolenta]
MRTLRSSASAHYYEWPRVLILQDWCALTPPQFADTDASSPHKASVTHELIAAAAAYEAAKAYEKHCRENGQPESHAKAKEIMAALTASFIDREVETKGVSRAVSFLSIFRCLLRCRCGRSTSPVSRSPMRSLVAVLTRCPASLPRFLPLPSAPLLTPCLAALRSAPPFFPSPLPAFLDFIDKEEAKRQAHERNEQMLKQNWDSY